MLCHSIGLLWVWIVGRLGFLGRPALLGPGLDHSTKIFILFVEWSSLQILGEGFHCHLEEERIVLSGHRQALHMGGVHAGGAWAFYAGVCGWYY